MSSRPIRTVVSIGECMVELSVPADFESGGAVGLRFGGDSLNTAVYLARLLDGPGERVAYATVVGTDPYSDRMVTSWEREAIDTALVRRHPTRIPGLYAIMTTPEGERSFTYWRGEAAARTLLEAPDDALHASLLAFDCIYLSGISVAILSEDGRRRLADCLGEHRVKGGTVAFDSNYRPRLWVSPEAARETMERFWHLATIGFPSLDDELALFEEDSESAVVARLKGYGLSECVLKRGDGGPLMVAGGTLPDQPLDRPAEVVDTTAAGDSFNAGYLAARARGLEPGAAALHGHRLAVAVVQHRGAIVPREATDAARAMLE